MSHNHHHPHRPTDFNRAFAIGVTLNVVFVVVEVIFGVVAGSLALIADAGHNLSDVLTLLLAWGAAALAVRKPTPRRTYGFRRVTILASLISAGLLFMALGAIAWEAVARLGTPREVSGVTVISVAAVGVVINAATAMLFASGQKQDLNIKAAYLHMAADAAVSLGVVVAGVGMLWKPDWLWLDPTLSLVIVGVVLIGSRDLFTDSINLAIDSVPSDIDPERVEDYLRSLPEVDELHDLHIWAMSTTETALTVHLVVPTPQTDDRFLQTVSTELHERFGIPHTTIQLERGEMSGTCPLDRPECIEQGGEV